MQAQFLTGEELAARWKINKQTLNNWRHRRNTGKPGQKGPAFVKIGSRVLYPLEQVELWERSNMQGANDNQSQTDNQSKV